MNQLIIAHRAEIEELCRHYNVSKLELFGSATTNQKESQIGDLDFLVDFASLKKIGYAEAYFGLLESLQTLFNKPVDLIMLSAVKNPYLLQNIDKSRVVLYAA